MYDSVAGIGQRRSMNDRNVLTSLSQLTTAQLMQEYNNNKTFNINDFRQNVERLDYSLKGGLAGVNLQQQQQQQQHQQQQQQQQLMTKVATATLCAKPDYSPRDSPVTPTLSEQSEQKVRFVDLPHFMLHRIIEISHFLCSAV